MLACQKKLIVSLLSVRPLTWHEFCFFFPSLIRAAASSQRQFPLLTVNTETIAAVELVSLWDAVFWWANYAAHSPKRPFINLSALLSYMEYTVMDRGESLTQNGGKNRRKQSVNIHDSDSFNQMNEDAILLLVSLVHLVQAGDCSEERINCVIIHIKNNTQ